MLWDHFGILEPSLRCSMASCWHQVDYQVLVSAICCIIGCNCLALVNTGNEGYGNAVLHTTSFRLCTPHSGSCHLTSGGWWKKGGGREGGRLLERYRESHPFNALVSITVARWRAQKRPNWIEMTHVIWCAARGVHRRSLWWPSSKWSPEQVTSWRWSITWSFYLR